MKILVELEYDEYLGTDWLNDDFKVMIYSTGHTDSDLLSAKVVSKVNEPLPIGKNGRIYHEETEMTDEKRTVIIAELDDDNFVTHRRVDDCYVCPYDTGDKFAEHTCRLTDEYLHHGGRMDIDVPESCPFPVFGIDQLNNGIIDRYPDITDDKLTEIVEYIAVHKKD